MDKTQIPPIGGGTPLVRREYNLLVPNTPKLPEYPSVRLQWH